MNLHSLYGNLKNFEETKVPRKEIMMDTFKERYFALLTKKSSFVPESESEKLDNVDYDEEYNPELYSSDAMIVRHFKKAENKKVGRARK